MSNHLQTADRPRQESLPGFDFGRTVDTYRFKVRVGSPVAIPTELAARLQHGRRVYGTFSGVMLAFGGDTKKADGAFEITLVAELDELDISKVSEDE